MSDKERSDSQQVSYKDTLNLPHTDFPIRPNPTVDDPALLKRWAQDSLYEKATELNQGKKKFILHDGPPYANGHIHLGHAYNKIIKDIITKAQRMSGKQVPVIPGWDCHGLPIELKVTKEKPGLTPQELKKACREYASSWIDIQREEFKKLGVVMDWEHPYKTMDPKYEASILKAFGAFVDAGYIERKNKTVPWCFSCQTVLAAAEIEHYDRKDPSVFVRFPLEAASIAKALPALNGKEVSLLVWTTTPWTLPLNRAVFIHPKANYVVLDINGSLVVVGAALADKVCALMGVEKKIIADIPSQTLVGSTARHPFVAGLTVPVLADAFVSLEDGTACVHSAPGCGPEDYEMGIRYGLEIFSPLSPDGKYTKGIQPTELEGMSITDGQIWVLRTLTANGTLLFKTSIKHSYPHCWRCHNGLMFRATSQWFCNLAQHGLREKALAAIDSVNFIPDRSSNFLRATIQNRLEWCLSRQRIWGIPIPALVCKQGDYAFIDAALVEKVAAGVAREGIEYWDNVAVETLKPAGLSCKVCGSKEFVKEKDILDVWFDSGVSHYAVLRNNPELAYPADMYVEGVDQHRGWFQSSLLTSLVLEKEACFKSVITHGFTVDEQGRKMSKSLGNVVSPDQLIEQLGTDGLRLWVSSISYDGDAIVSPVLLNNVKEVYRKVRNTCRFLLSNLYDFDAEKDLVPLDQMLLLDRYAIAQLLETNKKIRTAYERADLTAIFQELGSYCSGELSSFYLDIIKDRLYVEKADGLERRSAQTACWYILDTLTHLLAPIFSFTAELMSDEYQKNKKVSIHLQPFAQLPQAIVGIDDAQWQLLRNVRSAILKAIELEREKGLIKHSLEARVALFFDPASNGSELLKNFFELLKVAGQTKESFFKEWCIVSQVEFATTTSGLSLSIFPGLYVAVTHAQGQKCPRCWQWGTRSDEHALCSRCSKIVSSQVIKTQ